MTTLPQKLQAMQDAFAALFSSAAQGDEKLEPGDFVLDQSLQVGYANIDGKPMILKCRGSFTTDAVRPS